MADDRCRECESRRAESELAQQRIAQLEAATATLHEQLRETLKLSELQQADIDRYRAVIEASRPNRPERVLDAKLQMVFEQIVGSLGGAPAANDSMPSDDTAAEKVNSPPTESRGHRGRHSLDLSKLPVESIHVDPPEVVAVGGVGWKKISDEVSDRLARKRGGFFCLRTSRGVWVRDDATAVAKIAEEPLSIATAPIPDSLWPRVMADASTVSHIIVSKYEDSLPLHRQETITGRQGFVVPRSTQCSWLSAAFDFTYRIVDAMMADGVANAHVIATDATGAPVWAPRQCEHWHVFVFAMQHDHVVFRYSKTHDGASVREMLDGYHGVLLADGSSIFDVLYREERMTEGGCWSHARRYFWKALESDHARAIEALSIIAQLFAIERGTQGMSPEERQRFRAARAGPVLKVFDRWIGTQREHVDRRSPMDRAFGYYTRQRTALHRFVHDGHLPMNNNVSERALRNLALGRRNYTFFMGETGLKWYVTFRSLIASSVLHKLNPEIYLEQLLRLAPHWPVTRMLDLSPKYWARTVETLDAHQRAIITPPWECDRSGPAVAVPPAPSSRDRAA